MTRLASPCHGRPPLPGAERDRSTHHAMEAREPLAGLAYIRAVRSFGCSHRRPRGRTHPRRVCRRHIPAQPAASRPPVRHAGRNRPREGAPATTTRPGGNPSSWPPRGKGTIYHQARLLAARIGLVPATRPEPLAGRGRRAELLGPLADRPFRFLWLAATTPSTGSAFTPVALAFAVLGLGGTAHLTEPGTPRRYGRGTHALSHRRGMG